MELKSTLSSHILAVSSFILTYDASKMRNQISVGTSLLNFKIAYMIGLAHFEFYSENKVGNNGILVLWGVCQKVYCREQVSKGLQ